jgi:tripeptidyl-peptidase-1
MTILVWTIAAFTAFAQALPTRSPMMVRETHTVPDSWERVGPAPQDHVVQLCIGLKQGNFKELERHLYESKNIEMHTQNSSRER